MQILGIKPPPNEEEVKRRYEHLFSANEKSKGGTLYLQAKVRNFLKNNLNNFLDLSSKRKIGCWIDENSKRKCWKNWTKIGDWVIRYFRKMFYFFLFFMLQVFSHLTMWENIFLHIFEILLKMIYLKSFVWLIN